MANNLRIFTTTIHEGESLSDVVATNLWVPVAILVPAGFIGTFLTFQVSIQGLSNVSVFDDDTDESAVAIPDVSADPFKDGALVGLTTRRAGLEALRWADSLKVRAGTRLAPVVQDQDIILKILVKEFNLV